MNDETPIELEKGSSDAAMDISTDASSDTPEISRNEQIFDISEDNISPINEPMPAVEFFPMKKKVVAPPQPAAPITLKSSFTVNPPTAPIQATPIPVAPKPIAPTPPVPAPAPASIPTTPSPTPIPQPVVPSKPAEVASPRSFVSAFSKPAVDANPLQKSPFVASAPKPVEPEMPTKNILDPNYSGPGAFAAKNATSTPAPTPIPQPAKPFVATPAPTPIVTPTPEPTVPKIKLPPLPETPAFKGTLDSKPHQFTPSVASTPTANIKTEAPKSTTRPALNVYSATTADLTPKAPTPSPIPTPPPVAPTPAPTPIQATPSPTPTSGKSIGSIPLQDISGPISSAMRTGPANPSAKTLGATPNLSNQDAKFQSTDNPDLKRLRTYESDVADVLSHRKISTASIAIAENKKVMEEQVQTQVAPIPVEENVTPDSSVPKSHGVLKVFVTLLIFIFILGGIGGAYYLYSKSALAPLPQNNTSSNVPVQNDIGDLFSDAGLSINARGLDPLDIVALIRKEYEKSQKPNTIRELILTNGQSRITANEMIELMDIDAPDMLTRSLVAPWMLGISADEKGDKDVFVIVGTNFFQNTFAGMLQWENVMADDLKLYLSSGARGIANAPIATSSVIIGTSTLSATESGIDPYFTIRGQFEDRIIMNKDVRVFRTNQGKVLFLYSFIDNAKLIIATKEKTVAEILNRLEKQAFVR